MADSELMNVLDSANEFLEVLACLLFVESLILYDDVKQLSAAYELHHQIKVLFSLNNFVDLHHVRVVQLLQYFYLAADSFNVLLVLYS